MSEQGDHPTSILDRLRLQLNQVFDDLTSMFDRSDGINLHGDYPKELERTTIITANIISNYWNIPLHVIYQDYIEEMKRRKELSIETPEIPTYQMRFALEEGAWIVLLRVKYREIIKDKFNRLLSLEDLIWHTEAGQAEDMAYYVIEIDQISENFVEPLNTLWIQDHDYGKSLDLAPRVIASAHVVTSQRGKMMLDGAKRLLRSKMQQLKKIYDLESTSPWSLKAKSKIKVLEESLSNDNLNQYTLSFLITLALLQKELMVMRTKERDDTLKSNNDELLTGIKWSKLDPGDQKNIDKFTKRIIALLYQIPQEDPILAGEELLSSLMDGLEVPSGLKKSITSDYHERLDKVKRESRDPFEMESRIAEAVKNTLPQLLIDLKINETNWSKHVLSSREIDELPIWISFQENLNRIKRLDDPKMAKNIILKGLKSIFDLLISYRVPSHQIYMTVLRHLNLDLRMSLEVERLESQLELKLKEIKADTNDLSHIDREVMDWLTDELMELLF